MQPLIRKEKETELKEILETVGLNNIFVSYKIDLMCSLMVLKPEVVFQLDKESGKNIPGSVKTTMQILIESYAKLMNQ